MCPPAEAKVQNNQFRCYVCIYLSDCIIYHGLTHFCNFGSILHPSLILLCPRAVKLSELSVEHFDAIFFCVQSVFLMIASFFHYCNVTIIMHTTTVDQEIFVVTNFRRRCFPMKIKHGEIFLYALVSTLCIAYVRVYDEN
jgi:hypothetical protein